MVSESVLHPAHPAVIRVEDARVALPGAAVVDDDIFPPALSHLGLVYRPADRRSQVAPPFKPSAGALGCGLQPLVLLQARLLDENGGVQAFPAGCLSLRNLG